MKTLICVLLATLVHLTGVASEKYVTDAGFVFIKIKDSQFGVAWKDSEGRIWSQLLGFFDNSGGELQKIDEFNESFLIKNSAATKACEAIGGKLPTVADYKKLLSYFKTTQGYLALFPTPSGNVGMNWTSEAVPLFGTNRYEARYVQIGPYLDPYGDLDHADTQYGVQCVH